ncbi:putative lipid-transfer protein DIR1-like protein [Carex littledalei]|uniref:Putative lipid-transfer protein DIR1-like protein n=1 Tax=Carex littledalei TaxID=544730 RepID=A0A833QKC5_9POAL|nr:putative lipid-transfer protein DIR1-like protein [Carex littledalei]
MDTKVQILLAITLACMVILLPAAEARAAKDCKANIADLISCMPCIRNTNPDPKPTEECCKALEKADLPCLCSSYKNSPELKKLGINTKLAMALPGKCKLTVPKECH